MATNIPKNLTKVSFPKPIFKLYLYKISRNSPLWDFNHDFRKIRLQKQMQDYVATGGDPADLDLPSKTVRDLLQSSSFARLPFDSWIPRKIDTDINLWSGVPTSEAKALKIPEAKAFFELEDMDRYNIRLNWKNLYGEDFTSNFSKFFNTYKDYLIKTLQDVIGDFNTPGGKQRNLNRYNLTQFLVKYSHRTMVNEISNVLDLELASDPQALFSTGAEVRLSSATDMGDFHGDKADSGVIGSDSDREIPLVEENDVLELRVKYHNENSSKWELQESGFIDSDGYRRVFMGYVSSLVRTRKYNAQERVSLVANGLSKIFSIYDTLFTTSLAQKKLIEEGIEMSDLQFSIWANNCNGKDAETIFSNFMRAALFCNPIAEATESGPALAAKVKAAQADLALIEQNKNSTNPEFNPITPDEKKTLAQRKANDEAIIKNTQADIDKLRLNKLNLVFAPTNIKNAPSTAAAPPKDLDINYYVPVAPQDPKAVSFQIINYIPVLMQLAKWYALDDAILPVTPRQELLATVTATTEQANYISYKAMMQTAFRMFYPELRKPAEIFGDVKNNSFLELFEDRPGVIRLRPPKYNIINMNPEISEYSLLNKDTPTVLVPLAYGNSISYIPLNAEYTIPASVIEDISVQRDDMSIVTRSDHNFTVPFQGQPLDGYTGHFTDAGFLMKYGLRTTGPQQSPMALSPKIAEVLSALRMSAANAAARQVTLTVFNTREYQPGRLYYIPVSMPTQEEQRNAGIVSKGIVGYVVDINTTLDYPQAPSHKLTLQYVRQADILRVRPKDAINYVYYANFKKLPDVGTYMRLLATDGPFNQDVKRAINQKGDGKRDAISDNTSSTYDEFMVIPNGMDIKAFNPSVAIPFSEKLRAAGITKNIPNPDGDRALDAEQDNFVTTIYGPALQDEADVSISKDFLAKLTIYDVDALKYIYPQYLGNKPSWWKSLFGVSTPKLPQTDSMANRRTDDLMRVIYNMLVESLYYMYGKVNRFDPGADFSGITPEISTANDLRYIKSADDARVYQAKNNTNVSYNIVVAKGLVSDINRSAGFHQHVIYAFVTTTKNSGPTSTPSFSKFFAFHVPYGTNLTPSKSLRLANLINTGTPSGCGYRQISTVNGLTEATEVPASGVKGDVHSNGTALFFTNLDVSLWSFADIVASCVELDLKPVSDRNDLNVFDKDLSDNTSDVYHLINAFINCTIEPYNYIQGLNYSYNPNRVAEVSFVNETADSIMQDCAESLPDTINFVKKFKNYEVQEVNRKTVSDRTNNYVKSYFQDVLSTIKEMVLVPVNNDFFSSYSSEDSLFGKISKQQQFFPQSGWRRSLYTSVMTNMLMFEDTSAENRVIISPNPNTNIKYRLAPDRSAFDANTTYLDSFTFALDTDKVKLIQGAKGVTDLHDFIVSSTPQYALLGIQLIDNLALINPKEDYNYLTHIQSNALSNIWHTSYARSTFPFQSKVPEASRGPRVLSNGKPNEQNDMGDRLNLKGMSK